jgi:hypothetical protein
MASLLLLLGACADPPCQSCVIQEDQNFRYTADISIASRTVRDSPEVYLDWSGLSSDIHGHRRDPAKDLSGAWIPNVPRLTPAEVELALQTDTLLQWDLGLMASCTGQGAGCMLADFGLNGTLEGYDWFREGAGTWLVFVTSPLEAGGQGLVFLEPDHTSTVDEVAIDTGTSALEVEVDFRGVRPVRVPADEPDVLLDLRSLPRDGLGNSLYLPGLDRLSVGRYGAPLADLESRVFDLVPAADAVWSMELDGSGVVDLAELDGDEPWLGVHRRDTWLLAAWCSDCLNPAPKVVLVLEAG